MASNNLFRSYSGQDSVFIEKDQAKEIDNMKQIIKNGSVNDIKDFFFQSTTSNDLSISRVTENQIKRHSQVLNHRNRNVLKQMLQHVKETGSISS